MILAQELPSGRIARYFSYSGRTDNLRQVDSSRLEVIHAKGSGGYYAFPRINGFVFDARELSSFRPVKIVLIAHTNGLHLNFGSREFLVPVEILLSFFRIGPIGLIKTKGEHIGKYFACSSIADWLFADPAGEPDDTVPLIQIARELSDQKLRVSLHQRLLQGQSWTSEDIRALGQAELDEREKLGHPLEINDKDL